MKQIGTIPRNAGSRLLTEQRSIWNNPTSLILTITFISLAIGFGSACQSSGKEWPGANQSLIQARQKIKHVVIILQENRSFDHYFGMFPGVDGIPTDENGVPTVCIPDPASGECIKPFHDTNDVNAGGAHDSKAAVADINGGAMDGFLRMQQSGHIGAGKCRNPNDPGCAGVKAGIDRKDAIGYHTDEEIIGNTPGNSCCRIIFSRRTNRGVCPRICICFPLGRPSVRKMIR
jgi:hypothetical protein